MKQILILSCVLSGLVDPWKQLVNLALIVLTKELAASARKVMTVEL